MSDTHEVNEIGRWHDIPIFKTRMNEYMTKWMLTGKYDVDDLGDNEHNYFNYALNKEYVSFGSWLLVNLTDKGRAWLDEQQS